MKTPPRMLLVLAAVVVAGAALQVMKKRQASALEATNPSRGKAVHAVYATGTVEPTVMIPLAPRIAARIASLNADEGQQVSKGDVLAQLEDADLQSGIAELKAKEVLAAQELRRTEALLATRSISRAEADKARAGHEAAKAALARLQEEASYLRITAPEDGLVIRRDGEVGQLIPVGEPVFWLSCCAGLRISTEVDEEDIPYVKPGQKVLIRADAFGEEVFEGRVASITPKGDPIARSYRVRVVFDENVPLQIGMTAETNILIAERENALLIPSSSLVGEKVWLVEDGTLKPQKVKRGARGAEQTEILEGLSEESLLLVHPTDELKQGQSVRTRMATPTGS